MVHLDGCDDEDLARLAATDAWEITFMPEGFVMPDGTMVARLRCAGHWQRFPGFAVVGNGILDWAHRPQYLYGYAQDSCRDRRFA